ncbi:MAG: ABC transporter permease [Actinomycetes bacterium]
MLRAAWRSLVQHKLRLVLSMLAIILSVGFVVGTLIFGATLNRTFSELFAQTTSDVVVTADTEAQGSGFAGDVQTLPADLLPKVQSVSGAAAAGGTVFADGVAIIGSDGDPIGQSGAPQFGSNWSDDERLTPYRLIDGVGPSAEGDVAVDSKSADDGDLSVGDQVQLVTPKGLITANLVGIFQFGTSGNLAGATIASFDTATAQDLLVKGKDVYTSIDVAASEGVSQEQLATEVKGVVGTGVKVQTGDEAADEATKEITDDLGVFNNVLVAFSLVSLFVGAFLIVNTFSMLVGQRTKELALLRAVGATRGQIVRSVLVESAIVGLIASIIGCLFGIVVTKLLTIGFGALGIEMGNTPLVLKPSTFLIGLTLGVVITVFAAWFPARRASRIPPVAALRDDAAIPTASLRRRGIVGAVLLVVGGLALWFGATAENGSGFPLVGLGALGLLIGAIVFIPLLARPISRTVGWPLPHVFGTVGRLAMDNASRQPRRSAATASALMIGLALVTGFTVVAASLSQSVNAMVDDVIGAEFLVSNSTQRPFPRTIADQIEQIDGVASVSRSASLPADIDTGSGQPGETFLTTVDPESIGNVLDLTFTEGSLSDLNDQTVIVDKTTAQNAGLSVGDDVTFIFPTGTAKVEVAGIFEPQGFFGGYTITNGALEAAGVNVGDVFVYVKADQDADLSAIRASIDEILTDYPTVKVQSQAELKEEFQKNVSALLGVIVAMLGLAIFIAILGIVNTLYLSVLERTREIGMLRAVGTSRRQVRRMIVLESVVLAIFGAIVGLVLGLIFGVALQKTLEAFGVNILGIPWMQMVFYLIIAMIVGALAALWPARRAAKLDVLQAITTE